ncbi:hypothetical protein ACO0QE_003491 [Hanseniaspora vineae]
MFSYSPAPKDEQNLFLLKKALSYVSISESIQESNVKDTHAKTENVANTLSSFPEKAPKTPNPFAFFIDIPENEFLLANSEPGQVQDAQPLALIGDYRIALTDKLGEHKIDAVGNLQGERKYCMDSFTIPTVVTPKQPTRFLLLQRLLDILGDISKADFEATYPEIKIFQASNIKFKNQDMMEKSLGEYFADWFPEISKDNYFFVHARVAFLRFNALLITGGNRILDDYWEQVFINQGFTFRDRVFLVPNKIVNKAKTILGNTSSVLPRFKRNGKNKIQDLQRAKLDVVRERDDPFNYISEQPSMQLKKAYCNYQQQDLYFKNSTDLGAEDDDEEGFQNTENGAREKDENDADDEVSLDEIPAYPSRRGAGRPALASDASQLSTVAGLQHVIVPGQNITGGIELSSQYKVPRYATKVAYMQWQNSLNVPIGEVSNDRSESAVSAELNEHEDGMLHGANLESGSASEFPNSSATLVPTHSDSAPHLQAHSGISSASSGKNKRLLSGLLGDDTFQQKKKAAYYVRRYFESQNGDGIVDKNVQLNIDPWKFETLPLRKSYGSKKRGLKYNSKGLPIFEDEEQLKNRLKKLTPQQVMELQHQHDAVQLNKGISKLVAQREEKWGKYWLYKAGLPLYKDGSAFSGDYPQNEDLTAHIIKHDIENYEKVVLEKYEPDTNTDVITLEKRELGVNFKNCSSIEEFRPPYSIFPDES